MFRLLTRQTLFQCRRVCCECIKDTVRLQLSEHIGTERCSDTEVTDHHRKCIITEVLLYFYSSLYRSVCLCVCVIIKFQSLELRLCIKLLIGIMTSLLQQWLYVGKV